MLAIGPFPTGAVSTVAQRDSAAQTAQTPGSAHTITQTSRSELVQAVRQIDSAGQGDKLAWIPVKVMTDKQGRLVGPPPTFEVNVLETLREVSPNDTPDPPPPARDGYSEFRQIATGPENDSGMPVPELARRL